MSFFTVSFSRFALSRNYYPINSKRFCGAISQISHWQNHSHEIFWRPLLPRNLPAMAALHSVMQHYPALLTREQLSGIKCFPRNELPRA